MPLDTRSSTFFPKKALQSGRRGGRLPRARAPWPRDGPPSDQAREAFILFAGLRASGKFRDRDPRGLESAGLLLPNTLKSINSDEACIMKVGGASVVCLALGALVVLSELQHGASALSRVMEMTYEDFDEETKVPVYDGKGDFISLAFYSTWDLRVSRRTKQGFLSLPTLPESLSLSLI